MKKKNIINNAITFAGAIAGGAAVSTGKVFSADSKFRKGLCIANGILVPITVLLGMYDEEETKIANLIKGAAIGIIGASSFILTEKINNEYENR